MLEVAEGRADLEADLGQRLARPPARSQRLDALLALEQRLHQDAVRRFSVWIPVEDLRRRMDDQRRTLTGPPHRSEPLLGGVEPGSVELVRRGAREWFGGELLIRTSAPQCQRLVEERPGGLVDCSMSVRHEIDEAIRIDLVAVDVDSIAVSDAIEPGRTEELPQS